MLSLKKVGYIEFQFVPKMSEMLECHMFCADKYNGDIRECDGALKLA